MVRMTPLRTISINLNTEFLRVINMEEEVEVYTEVTKIGKNVVFSECHIYTDPNGARKLSSKGSHIKSVMKENWDYVVPWLESQSKVA
jgi:hypothetical protein